MKKIASILLLTICFISCKKENKPENLLNQQKMQELLYELFVVNGLYSNINQKDSIFLKQTPNQILVKYGLDSIRFIEQHRYYMANVEIYTQMLDSIDVKLKDEIKKVEALPDDPRDKHNIYDLNSINLSFLGNKEEIKD